MKGIEGRYEADSERSRRMTRRKEILRADSRLRRTKSNETGRR